MANPVTFAIAAECVHISECPVLVISGAKDVWHQVKHLLSNFIQYLGERFVLNVIFSFICNFVYFWCGHCKSKHPKLNKTNF